MRLIYIREQREYKAVDPVRNDYQEFELTLYGLDNNFFTNKQTKNINNRGKKNKTNKKKRVNHRSVPIAFQYVSCKGNNIVKFFDYTTFGCVTCIKKDRFFRGIAL